MSKEKVDKKKAEEERRKFTFSSIGEILRNAWRLTKLYWGWKDVRKSFFGLLFLTLLFSLFPFASSGLNGLLINELTSIFGTGELTNQVALLLVLIIVLQLVRPAIGNFYSYLRNIFRIDSQEKFMLWRLDKYSEMDIATHEDPKMNDLFQRVSQYGSGRIRQFMIFVLNSTQDLLEVIFAAAIILTIDWKLLVLVVVATTPRLIVEARLGLDVWNVAKDKSEAGRAQTHLRNHIASISSLTEIKLVGAAKDFLAKVKALYWEQESLFKGIERDRLQKELITSVISQSAIIASIVWLVLLVIEGNIQIGTFVFYTASISQLSGALSGFFSTIGWMHNDSLFVSDFFELVDTPQAITQPEKGVRLAKGVTPEIRFENVSFAYPGTDKLILKNFSLTIKPGEKVAMVGVNGAGKTTFVKLLTRFYDPTKGRILVGGHDLREVDLTSWYGHIGALFQDYANYHFVVKDAIAVSQPGKGTKLDKVKESAKAAEADIFVEDWEKGYKQMLGREFSGGVEPSVGQWQKLALARTFYRDPRVLILDEPTAAVDAEAEAKIFKKLEKLPSDRTVFLISHRFSTVRQANKIVVVKNGRNHEEGTHKDLLEKDGTYAKLFRLQAKGYK